MTAKEQVWGLTDGQRAFLKCQPDDDAGAKLSLDLDDQLRRARERIAEMEGELASRESGAQKFLSNLGKALDEPLPCGHDLINWCDRCETCGECEDIARAR